MGSLNGRVKSLERLAGTCARCSGVVLCIDTDGEPMSAHQWQEYEAGCPACGKRPPRIRVVWDDEHEEEEQMGRLENRLSRLEGRIEPPQDKDEEEIKRSRIRAELESFETRRRRMSPEEHKAWRESAEWAAEKEALEAELRRRREGR